MTMSSMTMSSMTMSSMLIDVERYKMTYMHTEDADFLESCMVMK